MYFPCIQVTLRKGALGPLSPAGDGRVRQVRGWWGAQTSPKCPASLVLNPAHASEK
jgi:hypothetical protein